MARNQETLAVRMARMEERQEAFLETMRKGMEDNGQVAREALKEIRMMGDEWRGETKAIRQELAKMGEKHNALEMKFAEGKATLRGFGLGYAGAFTAIGAAIASIIAYVIEWPK